MKRRKGGRQGRQGRIDDDEHYIKAVIRQVSSLFYIGRKYGHLRSGIIVVIDSDYIWGYNDNAVLF